MKTSKDRSKKSKPQAKRQKAHGERAAQVAPQDAEIAEVFDWLVQQDTAVRQQPRLIELRERLLEQGGERVMFLFPEPDIVLILEHGSLFNTDGLRMQTGGLHVERGDPHLPDENTARLWWQSQGRIRFGSGYALLESGLWVKHWWGLEVGRIVETTVRFQLYFGVVLGFKRSLENALTVPQLSDEISNTLEHGIASFPRVDEPAPENEARP